MMVFKSLLKKQQFRNCIVDVELHSQNETKHKNDFVLQNILLKIEVYIKDYVNNH